MFLLSEVENPTILKKKTRRLYLPEELNTTKMFDLFKIKYGNNKLLYEFYRNIFNTNFNISFGYPRTDSCSKYDEFKIRIEAIKIELSFNSECKKFKQQLDEVELQKEQHHKDAEIFYVRKQNAWFKAQREQRFESIAFDFQKISIYQIYQRMTFTTEENWHLIHLIFTCF